MCLESISSVLSGVGVCVDGFGTYWIFLVSFGCDQDQGEERFKNIRLPRPSFHSFHLLIDPDALGPYNYTIKNVSGLIPQRGIISASRVDAPLAKLHLRLV